MNKKFKFEYIDKPQETKYRRRVFLGVRDKPPVLSSLVHANSETTINRDLSNIGLFPTLYIWQSKTGENKFAEATINN